MLISEFHRILIKEGEIIFENLNFKFLLEIIKIV